MLMRKFFDTNEKWAQVNHLRCEPACSNEHDIENMFVINIHTAQTNGSQV